MIRFALLSATALALVACGGKSDKPKPEPKPTKPVSPADRLKPVERPTRLPTFLTLDELDKKHPTVPRARVAVPLALDASGKQATATWCIVAPDARPALHAVADQYELLDWQMTARQTTTDNTKGQMAADWKLGAADLHVQATVRKTAGCNPDEETIELSYTKMQPVASPPTAPDGTGPVPPPDRVPGAPPAPAPRPTQPR